ncbi:hypothetical protein CLU97_0817 [Chryseobacterium sp. 7]|uniref:hypothetical protein n=1 Tax=Chryseobacterium sp. 7 TaxID=2035214 RepID=UPI000EAF58FD|nr:hypothetical protein [Chryseobacterium sp. 7]RLJ31399.1 hypothetical protein CLU97_0817 [Chryseobacterium sp. 7]
MTFYQDNRRNPSQPCSSDTFKLSLSEILLECVPDIDKFLKEFLSSKEYPEYSDISPVYSNDQASKRPIKEREIIDYLVEIPAAAHILYWLFFKTTDEYFKNKIDLRITELTDAIGPRTGELVIKSY